MSAESKALAAVGIDLDRPMDLRNRIGRFMLSKGLFLGHRIEAGRVQDLIEEWTRDFAFHDPQRGDKGKQNWKCLRCGAIRVYGLIHPADRSRKQLNCEECEAVTPHAFAHMGDR